METTEKRKTTRNNPIYTLKIMQRETHIDIAKGIAIILMIIGHGKLPALADNFIYIVFTCHFSSSVVVIFFV